MRVGTLGQPLQGLLHPPGACGGIQLARQGGGSDGGIVARIAAGWCVGRVGIGGLRGGHRHGRHAAGHFHHRQAMGNGDGGSRLQHRMQQRQQQDPGRGGQQPWRACQQPRPGQRQRPQQHAEHRQRNLQQAAPGRARQRALRGLACPCRAPQARQRMPARPLPPQQHQQRPGQPAGQQRTRQRRGCKQRCQWPAHQQCRGHHCAAPGQRQPAGIGPQSLAGPAAAQQGQPQRQRHLRQPGGHRNQPRIQRAGARQRQADAQQEESQAACALRHRCPSRRTSGRG